MKMSFWSVPVASTYFCIRANMHIWSTNSIKTVFFPCIFRFVFQLHIFPFLIDFVIVSGIKLSKKKVKCTHLIISSYILGCFSVEDDCSINPITITLYRYHYLAQSWAQGWSIKFYHKKPRSTLLLYDTMHNHFIWNLTEMYRDCQWHRFHRTSQLLSCLVFRPNFLHQPGNAIYTTQSLFLRHVSSISQTDSSTDQ